MEIVKAALTQNGTDIHIGVPITKVDANKRTVSGYATLDNVDEHDDIVTSQASIDAFARWRGNVREMHAPLAVGKALAFQEQAYYDEKDAKFYSGIYVTVYVSKGAEATWQKVLDGTLTGFSIGGSMKKAIDEYDESKGKTVRKIVEYDLTELSLVDNPANQLANVVSIVKTVDGQTTGMAAEMKVENIFWCASDEIASTTTENSASCVKCGGSLENIGWLESNDDNKASVVQKAVDAKKSTSTVINYPSAIYGNLSSTNTSFPGYTVTISGVGGNTEEIAKQVAATLQRKGGADMDKDLEKSEAAPEGAPAEGVASGSPTAGPAVTNDVDAVVQPAANADEQAAVVTEVEEPDIAKMLTDLRDTLTNAIESTKNDTEKMLSTATDSIGEVIKSIDDKVSGLEGKFSELDQRVSTLNETVGSVEKRVDGVEDETAIKKSGDLGGSADEDNSEDNSFWKGSFLAATNELIK